MTRHGWGLAAAALLAAACSGNDEMQLLDAWEGTTPHFRTAGSFDGERLEAAIEPDHARDGTKLWCTREYQAPMLNGALDLKRAKLHEVHLNGFVTVNGVERAFEVEFKRNPFADAASGSKYTVIARDDFSLPKSDQMWFEWEWHDAEDETVVERAAQEGTFVFGELSGERDENGMISDDVGIFGGFIRAKWSESETISLSFTARCGKNEVESEDE